MSATCSLLDVPVIETKGEQETTYYFHKNEHAKCLLENLAEMQASEAGLLTDVVVCSKDRETEFHSMLLAASSPLVKKRLLERSSKSSGRRIVLNEMSEKMLECFKGFIYRSEVALDKGILDDLQNFAVKYDIDSLQAACEQCKDIQGGPSHQLEIGFNDHEEVLSELFGMFLEEEFTSTVLEDKDGKTQFAVHGPLIAAASPALQEAILEGSASARAKNTLNISSIAFADFIEYIYSAKVTVQRQNVSGLLEAACTYEMPALASACHDWLIERLDIFNVVSILCLVRELDSEYTRDLEEASKTYIVANFSELARNEDLNSLFYEDLKEIIQDDKLDIEKEEDVFHVVMKWIEYDEISRLYHLYDLLSIVRLELTSSEFIDEVKDNPRIARCPRCLQILNEARQKLDPAEDRCRPTLEVPGEEEEEEEEEEDGDDGNAAFDDASSLQLSEGETLKDYDGLCSESLSRYQDFLCDSDQPRETGLRRDGRPDMRFKENRGLYLEEGTNKNGKPDRRFRENRLKIPGPLKKNGTPDMRYKVNKEVFGRKERRAESPSTPNNKQRTAGPLKKNGTPDMRFKVNKEALESSSPKRPVYTADRETPSVRASLPCKMPSSSGDFVRPVKKDGTPDMRYTVNKRLYGAFSVTNSAPRGSSPAPLYMARGPMKKNGTPDMRFKANRR